MCLSCHSGICDDEVKQQLVTFLNDTNIEHKFEKCNTTAINHLFIAASGYNGDECKNVAIKILNEFICWYKQQQNGYLPTTGVENMYSKIYITNVIKDLQVDKQINSKDEATEYLLNILKKNENLKSIDNEPIKNIFEFGIIRFIKQLIGIY